MISDESSANVGQYEALLATKEGDTIHLRIEDFENTQFAKEQNPREIEGEVVKVKEDVSYSAGEIQQTLVIGDPRNGGCCIDVGDTAENNLTNFSSHSKKYLKAWRPRSGKDRVLLGRVTDVGVTDDQ